MSGRDCVGLPGRLLSPLGFYGDDPSLMHHLVSFLRRVPTLPS